MQVPVTKKREALNINVWVHHKDQLRRIVAALNEAGDLDANMTNVVERLISKEAKRLKV